MTTAKIIPLIRRKTLRAMMDATAWKLDGEVFDDGIY
jgi:hypothetical protein